MRVHVFSDLHLEFDLITFPKTVTDGSWAELVLLAGDIFFKRRGPEWAAKTFAQRVAMIGGNHEGYRDSLYPMIAESRKAAEATSDKRPNPIRYLERETWHLTGINGEPVRILGATLWTDFALLGEERRPLAMANAYAEMNDYAAIKIKDLYELSTRRLVPQDTLRIHLLSREFLEGELVNPFDGITIVMTHHAPSIRSVPVSSRSDPLTPCYASSLDPLIEQYQPALWVHGHIHTSSDYFIGRTRVVCNPRGNHPNWLNPAFDPELTIEIE